MGSACSKFPPDFEVSVKTGDVKGAGTDANVYIRLVAEDGGKTRNLHLDCKWKDDFEKGNTDIFKICTDFPCFGEVKELELWRDKTGINDDWYVEWIKIRRVHPAYPSEEAIFPIHRWVRSDRILVISKYDSLLPQFDKNKEQRKWELQEKKKVYSMGRKAPGIPKQVESLPVEERFSNEHRWDIQHMKMSLKMSAKITQLTSDAWESLEDLKNVYRGKLGVPCTFYTWQEDDNFSRQRTGGCSPGLIRLCQKIPDKLPVTNEMVKKFLEGFTLEEAMMNKKLYIVDLGIIEGVWCRDNRTIGKPIVLFYCNKDGKLKPIAIQLFQHPSPTNPVFLPSDPKYTWLLAKMYYNNAEASYHQACTHLGLTHLICETICLVTHHHLSPSHPIFRFLAPHFRYLLAINSLALAKLLAPNGWIDNTMTTGACGIVSLVAQGWQNWRMDVDGWLPSDLKERGVDDAEALPEYPYRDDALLTHKAIWDYVREYVEYIYDTEDKMLEDWEIQSWANGLVDPDDGGGIKGVRGNGKFTDREDLIKTLTSVVFLCSVAHSAANFAQYDEYAFPPNYPAFLRGEPPRSKTPLTERDIMSKIPVKDMTLNIMVVTKILSDKGTNSLGTFEIPYMFDPAGLKALENFKQELRKISRIIQDRNRRRDSPYPYLDPKDIPNAISI